MKCSLAWTWTVVLLGVAVGVVSAADPAPQPIGRKVADFTLQDFKGKTCKLSDFADKPAVVLAFLGTECPLATLYAPRLVELSQRFADRGVAIIGINSNQQDSLSEIAAYAKKHQIEFPLLKDLGNVVADQVGAVRTPEVFLLDKDRVIRYWGRIDDQYVVGRQRDEATREDLAAALDELLAGQPISQPTTAAPGCYIGRVHRPDPDAKVTFTRHVAAVFNKRCVECHRAGEIAPFALTSYDEAAGWADTIAEVVRDGRMPPWHADPAHGHFSNDARLSEAEKQTIYDWVAAGAPQGDPKDLPAPPQFAEGWRLPRIDQEVFMSDTPFEVPAEGTVSYKYFAVDPGFTEDKWIQGAQLKAGNRAVVHHIILFARGRRRGDDGRGITQGFVTATAPGAGPLLLEDGMAKLIPAGSRLIFQMHYTPNGSPQTDRSSVAFMFADPAKVKKRVQTNAAETHMIFIPPRVSDYKLEAWHVFRRDTLLLSLFPHMHVRGKAFQYEATYPDGTKEVLLDVPRYDFNWQQTYELAEPKLMPKGTRIRCTARYDNSVDNIANPNPNRVVTWGEQTWDEMLMGFFDSTPAEADGPADKTEQASADKASSSGAQ